MSYNGYTQLPSGSDSRQQQVIADTYDVLQRTSDSIQRSNQVAHETEAIGAGVSIVLPSYLHSWLIPFESQVLGELEGQRETLLRSARRLDDADQELSKSRAIIRKLGREVVYNRIILILIIILELAVLIGLLVLKFVHH